MNKIHALPWFPFNPYLDTIRTDKNITEPERQIPSQLDNSPAVLGPKKFENKTIPVKPNKEKRRYSWMLNRW